MRILRGAFFMSLLCGLGACSQIGRSRQCRALLGKVNPALDQIEELSTPAARDDPAKLRLISWRYDALAKSIEHDYPSDANLKQTATELRGTFAETSSTLRALAGSLSPPPNRSRAVEQRRQLDALVARERVAAAHVDGSCRGR